jgi:hypothetical protein
MTSLGGWREGRTRELLLIEPRNGLRTTLGAELRMRVYSRVLESDWRAIHPRSTIAKGTMVVARPEIARRVDERMTGVTEILPIALAGGSAALATARQLRLPGVVVLLTRSPEIRSFARDLVAGHHAVGLSLAAPDPADSDAVRRAARIARLILVDASCRRLSFETRAPVRRLWIVSDRTVRGLRRYLGG